MSDGRLKAAIQITAELTAMARRADGYRAGYAAGLEAAATVADTRRLISHDAASLHERTSVEAQTERCAGIEAAHIADTIRSLPIPEMDR
jgi:hypothetical protein